MRLIVEKMDGDVYVYLESEALYRSNEAERGSRRLPTSILDWECDLSAYADDVHWVFDLEGYDDEDEAEEDFDCGDSCGMHRCRRREDC